MHANLFDHVLDLVCPARCAGCGRPGRALCTACAESFAGPARTHAPIPSPPGLPPVAAAAAYDREVRAAIIAFKERGRVGLARPLGRGLAAAAAGFRPDVLVPVPSSRGARRSRGYDHAGLLAKAAARRLAGAAVVPALVHRRRTADQSGLGAADRAANLAAAFAVHPGAGRRLAGRRVVLVDDIITTGATLAEAARALRAAGIEPAGAAVVAATERRRGAAFEGSASGTPRQTRRGGSNLGS